MYSKLKTNKHILIGVGVLFRLDGNLYFVDQYNFDKIIDSTTTHYIKAEPKTEPKKIEDEEEDLIDLNYDGSEHVTESEPVSEPEPDESKFYDVFLSETHENDKYAFNNLGFLFKEVNKFNLMNMNDFIGPKVTNGTRPKTLKKELSWFKNIFSSSVGPSVSKEEVQVQVQEPQDLSNQLDSLTHKSIYFINKYIPWHDFVDYVLNQNLAVKLNKFDSVDRDDKTYGYGLVIYTEDDNLYLLKNNDIETYLSDFSDLSYKKEDLKELKNTGNYIDIIDPNTFYIVHNKKKYHYKNNGFNLMFSKMIKI